MPMDPLRNFKKQLVTTLGVEGSEITIQDIEVDPEHESSTADAIESIGDSADVDSLNEEAEELQNVGEAGDELIAAVESAISSGKGLTPTESVALKLTLKQLTHKFAPSFAAGMPAREDFGGRCDQLDTTVLAHEGLVSGFEAFWEQSKKHFQRVIEAIQKFFRSIVQKFTSVSKRALALKARAEDSTQDNSNTVQLNVANLRVGNEDLSKATTEGLSNILDVLNELLKTSRNIDDRSEVNQGVTAVEDASAWEDFVANVNSHAKRCFDAIPAREDNVTTLLPGNRAITFTQGESNTADQFSFESMVQFESGNGGETKQDVPALGRKQIIVVANLIVAIAKAIDDFDKIWARNSSKAARLIQGINAAAKKQSKAPEVDAQDESGKREEESRLTRFKINISALLNHVRRLDKFNSDLVAYAQLVSLDALAYGEASLDERQLPATAE